MLSREIRVSSNLVSYREREASQIPGNSNYRVKRFAKTFKENSALVLLSYDISAYLFLCLHLFKISVRLFSI